jgi:hypothetical protein
VVWAAAAAALVCAGLVQGANKGAIEGAELDRGTRSRRRRKGARLLEARFGSAGSSVTEFVYGARAH